LVVDAAARFCTYDEGRVVVYERGITDGFESVLNRQHVAQVELPYNIDEWEERFPDPP